MSRAERCELCRFWDWRWRDMGAPVPESEQCRRYPPEVATGYWDVAHRCPRTLSDFWCGEFRERESDAPQP